MKIGFLFLGKKAPLIDALVKEFFNVEFWDKSKIESAYEKRWGSFCADLENLCKGFDEVRFLVVFKKEDKRKSWYSDFQDKVVLNAAFNFHDPDFKGDFVKAIANFREIGPEAD